jgi:hypothetical protein
VQKIEPAIRLHVENQIELACVFVGKEVAALQAGGMQQDVDAAVACADLLDGLRDPVGIRQVDAELMRCPTRRLYRLNCGECGL